jgi:hypothetical protein
MFNAGSGTPTQMQDLEFECLTRRGYPGYRLNLADYWSEPSRIAASPNGGGYVVYVISFGQDRNWGLNMSNTAFTQQLFVLVEAGDAANLTIMDNIVNAI